MITKQQARDGHQLILAPNRSATWQQVQKLIIAIAIVCFGIAVVWASLGVWLILPFTGIEVGLLALIMYKMSRFTLRKEIIEFQAETICVSSGIDKPNQSWQLNRASARVLTMEVRHPEDPPCIHLLDHQQRLELGKYLNLDDKKHLLRELQAAGLTVEKVKMAVAIEV